MSIFLGFLFILTSNLPFLFLFKYQYLTISLKTKSEIVLIPFIIKENKKMIYIRIRIAKRMNPKLSNLLFSFKTRL